jgi:plastocyanin
MLNLTLNDGPSEAVRLDLDLVNRTSVDKVTRLTVNSSPGVGQLSVMALSGTDATRLVQRSSASWEITVGVQATSTFSKADLRLEFKAPARQGKPLVFQATLTDVRSAGGAVAAPTSTPQPSSGTVTTAQKSTESGGDKTETTSGGFSGYNWESIKEVTPIDASSITLINTAFVPQVWRVSAGTKVTFSNRDSIVHILAVEGHDITKTLNAGETLTSTFSKPGTYQVVCQIHPPTMFGKLVVTE